MWNNLDKVNEGKIEIVTFNRMTLVYICLHLRPPTFFVFLHSRSERVIFLISPTNSLELVLGRIEIKTLRGAYSNY